MNWLCFGCFRWCNDTVCPNCLEDAPDNAKETIIKQLSSPKDRQIEWYRLKMIGRKNA